QGCCPWRWSPATTLTVNRCQGRSPSGTGRASAASPQRQVHHQGTKSTKKSQRRTSLAGSTWSSLALSLRLVFLCVLCAFVVNSLRFHLDPRRRPRPPRHPFGPEQQFVADGSPDPFGQVARLDGRLDFDPQLGHRPGRIDLNPVLRNLGKTADDRFEGAGV